MKKYNFDEIIERKNTSSLKYDTSDIKDIIPMWVADMDFKTPTEVINALVERAKHGIFGYTINSDNYLNTVKEWLLKRHNFKIEKESIITMPGVVFALATAIKALTNEGDSVIIQRPVYYPFSYSIKNNNRKLINNPLVYSNGKYVIDFNDFENKIKTENVKLFILCNPHNPVGRVWTKEELTKLGDICVKYNVNVISDEIHSDFIYNNNKHIVFSDLKEEYKNITITCTAPSKTFNLAGLQISNIIVPNKEFRTKIKKEIQKTGYFEVNTMGLIACEAAYKYGEQWLSELLDYLYSNICYVENYISSNIPKLRVIKPEGTYLMWIDFSNIGLEAKEIDNLIKNKAKLWFDSGEMFGPEGNGFQRINIACPHKIIENSLEKLYNTFKTF